MKLAISGASGKTGFRIAEEALASGFKVRLLVRKSSLLPETLETCEKYVLSLGDENSLDEAIKGCDALLIATGAKPSFDLTGPARVDACGVQKQVESCKRVGVRRLVLVSSLCAGRLLHPLNLFGLILIWKRVGEEALEKSGLDWTVIRPGGLSETEDNLEEQGILFTGPNKQQDAYIPRRLVARCCIEAIKTPDSIGEIIEVTSDNSVPQIKMKEALREIRLST